MTWGSGRFWAYIGVVLGLGASLAANYAHTKVPPADAPAEWAPQPGALLLSLCWPVLLFVAVEILVRTDWPRQVRWLAVRHLGLLPVAGVAAFVSYRHMSGLLTYYGEDTLVATIGPLAIDGLMIMATGALLASRNTSADSPPTRASTRRDTKNDKPRRADDHDLAATARKIAHELERSQVPVTRHRIAAELRARGHGISNARASALVRHIKKT